MAPFSKLPKKPLRKPIRKSLSNEPAPAADIHALSEAAYCLCEDNGIGSTICREMRSRIHDLETISDPVSDEIDQPLLGRLKEPCNDIY